MLTAAHPLRTNLPVMLARRRLAAFLAFVAMAQLTLGSVVAGCSAHDAIASASNALHTQGHATFDVGGSAHRSMQHMPDMHAASSDDSGDTMANGVSMMGDTQSNGQPPCDHSMPGTCHGMLSCNAVIAFDESARYEIEARLALVTPRPIALLPGQIRTPVPPPPRA